MQDKATKGQSNYSTGKKSSRAKLTAAEAKLILEDPRPYLEIAAAFGVAAGTVGSIKQRVSWKEVDAIPAPKAKRIGMRGGKQWNAKLTEDGVRDIRNSNLSGKELAIKYGVTPASICDIQKRRSWKHLDD